MHNCIIRSQPSDDPVIFLMIWPLNILDVFDVGLMVLVFCSSILKLPLKWICAEFTAAVQPSIAWRNGSIRWKWFCLACRSLSCVMYARGPFSRRGSIAAGRRSRHLMMPCPLPNATQAVHKSTRLMRCASWRKSTLGSISTLLCSTFYAWQLQWRSRILYVLPFPSPSQKRSHWAANWSTQCVHKFIVSWHRFMIRTS